MEIRKNLWTRKAEKSFEISAFLAFSRSDLNRPKDLTGAEGLVLARGLGPVAALTVPRTVIHYRAASSPSSTNKDENKKPSLTAMAFYFGTPLQNRSLPQVFSKQIRVFRSADRCTPWR